MVKLHGSLFYRALVESQYLFSLSFRYNLYEVADETATSEKRDTLEKHD